MSDWFMLNPYRANNHNDDDISSPPSTLPPIAANFMTFPSKAAPVTTVLAAPSASASLSWNLKTVYDRIKRKEYVSPQELQAYRELLITLNQEPEEDWKRKYIQKLIKGDTGIGISGNYDEFIELVYNISGFEVTDLTDSGAAKSAGIKVGDRILYADGHACEYYWQFKYFILGKPSSEINLDLVSGTNRVTKIFKRNSSQDTSEILELSEFSKINLSTSLGGNKKRISKKTGENRKRLSKKGLTNRKRLSKKGLTNRKRLLKKKYNDLTGGANNCYLYLTLADTASNDIPWGGIHITLVGSGNTIEELLRLRQIEEVIKFADGSTRWSLSRESNLRIPSGENPTLDRLIFDSGILDRLSLVLNPLLKNVKGPQGNCEKKSKWHIGFPEGQLITKLREFQNTVFWHLTICREIVNAEGKKEYSWEKL